MYPLVLIWINKKQEENTGEQRNKKPSDGSSAWNDYHAGMVVHFDVSREKSIAAIQEAMAGDQKIFSCGTKINRNRRPYTGRCLRGGNCWNDTNRS